MASDGQSVQIPVTSLVHVGQAPTIPSGGKTLPPSGNSTSAAARPNPPTQQDLPAQVALLNKYLNDSGKPDQFRVDPDSDDKLIQQINPATGEVIGEYPADEFVALARSVGISGVIVDSHA
jgi:uncharacterized FlaG/YvyC family protein